MKTTIVIGGGLGGLLTGCILAKEGIKVTLVDKNTNIGGGLQSFKRFGEVFDTGMHVIGGMQYGGNVRKIYQWLGIMNDVRIMDVDDDCTDKLYCAEDRQWYAIAKGKERFVDSLSTYFPKERAAIEAYVKAIFEISSGIDLFNLRPSNGEMKMHSEDFLMAANDFIAKYIHDKKLRSIIAYMNPLYGGRENQTPAFIHAVINVMYIEGPSRFIGGSSKFAKTLECYIETHGGTVIKGDSVKWIEVNNRHVDFILTDKGKKMYADNYISAIHPCTMLNLMDEKTFPKSYRNRLNSIPNSYSAFSLYIKLKEKSFPYINYSEYYLSRYDEVWHFGRTDKPWPLGFLLMTPPEEEQGKYSRKVLVTVPMSFEKVRRWENTTVGKRGKEYELWKVKRTDEVLNLIEQMHPGICESIENINTSSPLTIRDYCGAKEGGISGFSKDCNNIILSHVPVVTKVENLYLTGQNNNLHGFYGVALTAIRTCEAILGANHIVNKILECEKKSCL